MVYQRRWQRCLQIGNGLLKNSLDRLFDLWQAENLAGDVQGKGTIFIRKQVTQRVDLLRVFGSKFYLGRRLIAARAVRRAGFLKGTACPIVVLFADGFALMLASTLRLAELQLPCRLWDLRLVEIAEVVTVTG